MGTKFSCGQRFRCTNLSAGGEAGSQQLADQLGDPRMAARWSATTLAIGLREVQFTLLTTDTGAQPVVAPGQFHLWSLALWDAYNRLLHQLAGYWINQLGIALKSWLANY